MNTNSLPLEWEERLRKLDIAFQPIVNIQTGELYGVEALLRNFQDIGFKSIFSIFDRVFKEGILYSFDIALRKKTLDKFKQIQNYKDIKLFYNLDNRLFDMQDFSSGNTAAILKNLSMKKENLCFEISERHEIVDTYRMEKILRHYQEEQYAIAIDDFGTGYSGYKLLFDTKPNTIKIDRYFLQDIQKDMKKKLMVKSITYLAIQLGIEVLAEGVETKEEYLTCRDIGCHLVQGYFVCRPTTEIKEITKTYDVLTQLTSLREADSSFVQRHIQKLVPLYKRYTMHDVLSYFKEHRDIPIVPVVNNNDEGVGVFFESQIKEYLYSPYGMSLLLNDKSDKAKLKHFIQPCLHTDINSDITTIIEIFSSNPEASGIIITKNSKYYGFLSANDIITIMHEENLIAARDQNPLTKLPGNRLVEKYIHDATIDQKTNSYLLCYFDLDNFKAFNDKYGFRLGDRVIQLFADTINKHLPKSFFKGHIGGDDFFVGTILEESFEQSIKRIQKVITKFSTNAKDFYSQEDKKQGFIMAKDRDGMEKRFDFLTVSAAVIILNEKKRSQNGQKLNKIFSIEKKLAKKDKDHLCVSSLM